MRSLILFHFDEFGTPAPKPENYGRYDLCQTAIGADTTNNSSNGRFNGGLSIDAWGLVQAGLSASIPRTNLSIGAWTLDFWFKTLPDWATATPADLITFTGDTASFKMIRGTRSGANFTLDCGANNLFSDTYAYTQANHTHIALVKMANMVHLYEDGIGTDTFDLATFGITSDEYTTISIGTGEDIGDIDFYGIISELRFTDAAMFIGDFDPPMIPYND